MIWMKVFLVLRTCGLDPVPDTTSPLKGRMVSQTVILSKGNGKKTNSKKRIVLFLVTEIRWNLQKGKQICEYMNLIGYYPGNFKMLQESGGISKLGRM